VKTYSVYDPMTWNMQNMTDTNESYCILFEDSKDLAREGTLARIRCDNYEQPSRIIQEDAEKIVFRAEELADIRPIFRKIMVASDNTIVLPESKDFRLTERQFEILAYPNIIRTLSGQYCLERENNGYYEFRRDRSLDGIPPVKLNMEQFVSAVNKKYPKLLCDDGITYGCKRPYFPNAVFYRNRNQAVVFMTKKQTEELPHEVLQYGFYYDPFIRKMWDVRSTYGICVIDDSEPEYTIKLLSPKILERKGGYV